MKGLLVVLIVVLIGAGFVQSLHAIKAKGAEVDTVLPYAPATGAFGPGIQVCPGASSMAVTAG